MNWTMAREWCWINNHTDMVVIQNQEENNFLLNILPDRTGSPYYWIGIKKINGNWTWVGTNGTWVGNSSWAPNEPNNKLGEECVELYVNKRNSKNNGKWNDDMCSNLKYSLCYRGEGLNHCFSCFFLKATSKSFDESCVEIVTYIT